MSFDMIMPKMGESITEGTILKWLKGEGDAVERDEIILEISTDKVDSEIPSPTSGVLAKILVPEGETVEVGTKLAVIAGAGETVAEPAEAPAPAIEPPAEESRPQPVAPAAAETPAPPPPVAAEAAAAPTLAAQNGKRGGRFYSPLVRSIAAQEGISLQELEQIPGSGRGGRVNKSDILSYVESRQAAPAAAVAAMPAAPAPAGPAAERMPQMAAVPAPEGSPGEVIEMDNMRKSIAEHMVRSMRTSPHVYSLSEVDVTHLVAYREAVKEIFQQKEGFKLTYTPFFIYAAAKALRDFPFINASLDETKIILKKDVNIGTAVALESGLIVPVVKHADTLNLLGIARTLNDLANRARNKRLLPDEVQDGTFTITNVGTFGSLFGTPIISQPQVAILGIGAIKKRVVVVNNTIAIRDMVYLSLGYDHRIVDGALGSMFLERIVHYLEKMNPEQL